MARLDCLVGTPKGGGLGKPWEGSGAAMPRGAPRQLHKAAVLTARRGMYLGCRR